MNLTPFLNYIAGLLLLILVYQMAIWPNMPRNKDKKCSNCTECCKLRVQLSKEDIKRIKTDLDYIEKRRWRKWIKRVNGYCIFLEIKEGKSKCSIYDMRPKICRRFPYSKFLGIKIKDMRCKKLE